VSLRELIGLVVLFALWNKLLAFVFQFARTPHGSLGGTPPPVEPLRDALIFVVMNGFLIYIAFFAGILYEGSPLRLRPADSEAHSSRPPRWSILGFAEVILISVILGLHVVWIVFKARISGLDGGDSEDLAIIALIVTIGATVVITRKRSLA
jgi:hypothetical protein